MTSTILDIAFIGCGSVGKPLGRILASKGVTIRTVCCTSLASAEAACRFIGQGRPLESHQAREAAASAMITIIATPDRAIGEVDAIIAPSLERGSVVLHLSGAFASTVLAASGSRGASTGSMHPLQSFSDLEESLSLIPGSLFACEGDKEAVATARVIATLVGGKPVLIPTENKPLYHAAAVAASNFLVSLLCFSADLMESAGLGREDGLEALMPLVQGTLKNARSKGVPAALTGPVERGDVATVRAHMDALAAICPDLERKYAAFCGITIEAAARKGSIGQAAAEEMKKAIAGKG